MDELQVLNAIRNFPIGSIPQNRIELLSKAEIIAFLSRTQEQFYAIENQDEIEKMVSDFLSQALALGQNETLPSLGEATINLKLSNGFVQDFGKIQYLRENNPEFDRTYDMIARELGLNEPHKSR